MGANTDTSQLQKQYQQMTNPNRLFGGRYGAGSTPQSITGDSYQSNLPSSPSASPAALPSAPQSIPSAPSTSNDLLQKLLGSINTAGQSSGQAPSKF